MYSSIFSNKSFQFFSHKHVTGKNFKSCPIAIEQCQNIYLLEQHFFNIFYMKTKFLGCSDFHTCMPTPCFCHWVCLKKSSTVMKKKKGFVEQSLKLCCHIFVIHTDNITSTIAFLWFVLGLIQRTLLTHLLGAHQLQSGLQKCAHRHAQMQVSIAPP